MKIITVTLEHAGKVVKVTEAGVNALAAVDAISRAGYDINTATDIKIKTVAPQEYASCQLPA